MSAHFHSHLSTLQDLHRDGSDYLQTQRRYPKTLICRGINQSQLSGERRTYHRTMELLMF